LARGPAEQDSSPPAYQTRIFHHQKIVGIHGLLTGKLLVRIVVVKAIPLLQADLTSCLNIQANGWVHLVSTLHEAKRLFDTIGYLHVDISSFDWGSIKNLTTPHKTLNIAGKLNLQDIKPIEVIRFCRDYEDRFFDVWLGRTRR
jgi:hypothetical protein